MRAPCLLFHPAWTIVGPILAVAVAGSSLLMSPRPALYGSEVVALFICVLAAAYHADVVALKVGEPLGAIVLGAAVTMIEVALIVVVMVQSGPENAGLARDTVFASIMIVCNGVMGLCLLTGGIRHGEQGFRIRGASSALAVLAVLTVLLLVMPNYTSRRLGPMLTPPQLAFAGVSSFILYGVFIFIQTVRHPQYFSTQCETGHFVVPHVTKTTVSVVTLLVCLGLVVLLAEELSPALERTADLLTAPRPLVGIVIAILVVLPEALTAIRAACANRLQRSLNLAIGSALASVGLTIPIIAIAFLLTGRPLALGIDGRDTLFLSLTLLVCTLTLGTGRTTILQGVVHLSLFGAYMFLSLFPD